MAEWGGGGVGGSWVGWMKGSELRAVWTLPGAAELTCCASQRPFFSRKSSTGFRPHQPPLTAPFLPPATRGRPPSASCGSAGTGWRWKPTLSPHHYHPTALRRHLFPQWDPAGVLLLSWWSREKGEVGEGEGGGREGRGRGSCPALGEGGGNKSSGALSHIHTLHHTTTTTICT